MNANSHRRKALGNYLKSRRTKLAPGKVGLPSGHTRRRTPGLRREELADMAGVSLSWYTWLEQGCDIHVSKEVLASVGRALKLNGGKYRQVMNLAQFPVSSDR
ncbi:helix-turn-helix domain-containing protein [Paenibacillus beijingensis]|uniref:helix-turn-helix domain-containing protein n=1 Tax=Paenibacillus beijingensis TaxID=1126833 RepID=UPI0009E1EAF7|nr:helix-turn-helix transcriptional regulator [Paenibacillus beijingensis]